MMTSKLVSCLFVAVIAGCSNRGESSFSEVVPNTDGGTMSQQANEIDIKGFDPEGEPVIQKISDGSLQIVFNFMPPSYVDDDEAMGDFDDFDKQIQAAIGVPVMWEDREIFVVETPENDTIDRLKSFLENYRDN